MKKIQLFALSLVLFFAQIYLSYAAPLSGYQGTAGSSGMQSSTQTVGDTTYYVNSDNTGDWYSYATPAPSSSPSQSGSTCYYRICSQNNITGKVFCATQSSHDKNCTSRTNCSSDADCGVPSPVSSGSTSPTASCIPCPTGAFCTGAGGYCATPTSGGTSYCPPSPSCSYRYCFNDSCRIRTLARTICPANECRSNADCNCEISVFTINDKDKSPVKTWVTQVNQGHWEASDNCDNCNISCNPYPKCVWQKNNIGTGEPGSVYEFKIGESGSYTYTLTCYNNYETSSKTLEMEANNLPWWREVVPF